MSPFPRILLLTLGSALLGACAVGPNYKRPPADTGASFKELGDWKPSEPADTLDRGPWWQIFKDPVLEQLEQQIDVSNQTLKAAVDAYRQAEALVKQSEAGFWPTITGSAGHTRQQGQTVQGVPAGTSTLSSVYSAGASASWELDIWGEVRRTVESNSAAAQSSAAAVAGTRLLEQATLASDYFQLRAQDELKRILDQTVDDEQKSLKITQNQYAVGVAAKADVVTAQTQLLASQAQQINAGILRATLEHAIAVLVGQVPSTFAIAPFRSGSSGRTRAAKPRRTAGWCDGASGPSPGGAPTSTPFSYEASPTKRAPARVRARASPLAASRAPGCPRSLPPWDGSSAWPSIPPSASAARPWGPACGRASRYGPMFLRRWAPTSSAPPSRPRISSGFPA